MEARGPSAYVAEFIGTLVLVLFVGIVLSVFNTTPEGIGYENYTAVGLLHVFVLAMLVASLGGVSGAHFNPAVTVTLLALRKIRPPDALIYILLQLAGAVAAALLLKMVLSDEGDTVNFGATAINERAVEGDLLPAMTLEAIGTFALMMAIMGTAVNPRADRAWAPLIIGGTLGMAVMAIGPLTGAGFNPARVFGPALVGESFGGADTFLVAYTLGPIVGAMLAGMLYHALALAPKHREGARPVDKLDDDVLDVRDTTVATPPAAPAAPRVETTPEPGTSAGDGDPPPPAPTST